MHELAVNCAKEKTAAPAGPRNGGKKLRKQGKTSKPEHRAKAPPLASLVPIWSDDRRYLQGWEVLP
jgi:hypothetical protein